ncbi:protease complex subunit PrcB family protein [Caldinitratiruptor microaerophilus]|uniref:PrcB C-terminal domain-containing protein n=1 Tax=Caldinitratiruptor microaerophilus TaxID=671077 RepID=A0AA35CKR9_9FIRM|nr:protease complex subunit PrcB family protein [Caldinitratiruptor microaerophilus]BDG59125.1 hypothetical protein caldi_02150 [Caldinitratiruptor microaerophilus]
MRFLLLSSPQPRVELPGEFAPPAVVDLRPVDWERELALIADMGEQRTGGYSVRVLGVKVESGQALVDLEVRRPAPGGLVTQAITHPACLARIPRAGLAPGARIRVRDQQGDVLADLPAPPA